MNAIIVDDARIARTILHRILSALGIIVVEAENGRDGLDQLKLVGKPDVAFVDWNMPVMDGLAFVRAVRAVPDYNVMKIVMVTGEDNPLLLQEALSAGADACVSKPFTPALFRQEFARMGIEVA